MRAACAWSLGLLHEGKSDAELARMVEERLVDVGRPMIPPEDARVRWMCAITLGRMKSKEMLASLRRFQATATPTIDPVAHACSWAIEQIAGERAPPGGTVQFPAGTFKNWFRSIQPESKRAG
jgi:hypothetical protein